MKTIVKNTARPESRNTCSKRISDKTMRKEVRQLRDLRRGGKKNLWVSAD